MDDSDDWKQDFALQMRKGLIADTIYQVFDIDPESTFEKEQFDDMFERHYACAVFLLNVNDHSMTEELCITNKRTDKSYQVAKFKYQTTPEDELSQLEFRCMAGRDYQLFCHDEGLPTHFHTPENN